jgi:hypothetical protein
MRCAQHEGFYIKSISNWENHQKLFTLPTSFATPEVKIWVKAKAASPAQQANPQEKDAITTLRSELFMEKFFSSLSFFNPEARVVPMYLNRTESHEASFFKRF